MSKFEKILNALYTNKQAMLYFYIVLGVIALIFIVLIIITSIKSKKEVKKEVVTTSDLDKTSVLKQEDLTKTSAITPVPNEVKEEVKAENTITEVKLPEENPVDPLTKREVPAYLEPKEETEANVFLEKHEETPVSQEPVAASEPVKEEVKEETPVMPEVVPLEPTPEPVMPTPVPETNFGEGKSITELLQGTDAPIVEETKEEITPAIEEPTIEIPKMKLEEVKEEDTAIVPIEEPKVEEPIIEEPPVMPEFIPDAAPEVKEEPVTPVVSIEQPKVEETKEEPKVEEKPISNTQTFNTNDLKSRLELLKAKEKEEKKTDENLDNIMKNVGLEDTMVIPGLSNEDESKLFGR